MFGDKIYPNSLVMADKFGAGYCQVTFVSVKTNFEITKKLDKNMEFSENFNIPYPFVKYLVN